MNKRKFIISLLALGISSISTQLVVIREMMSTFGGNEIVMGATLGLWLLLTGAGSKLGAIYGKALQARKLLFFCHILIAVLPFIQVAGIRAIPLFRLQGELLGLGSVLGVSSLILLPYCLVSGGMLPIAASLLKEKDAPRKVFIADAAGDIAGGLLFSLILVHFFSHWSTLIILGLINLLAAFVMAASSVALPVLILLGIGLSCSAPADRITQSWHFPGQEVLTVTNTRYAQLAITRSGKQLNVLQDALPLFSTEKPDAETLAHLPLSQIEKPDSVLVISGGIFGTIREILRYHPKQIDYVELDPAIIELAPLIHDHGLDDPTVHLHTGDGRLFVKKTSMQYHVVICDLPDPENIQLNRFYTEEFFREVCDILHDDGVFCFTLSGSANYMGKECLLLNRSVYAAAKKVFTNVLVFPGDTHYYLASDAPLTSDIAQVMADRGITTKRLVHYELPVMTDRLRLDQLKKILSQETEKANHDLSPFAFGHILNLWAEKSGSRSILLVVLFVLAIGSAILISTRGAVRYVILSTGYAAIGMELFLLLLFQIIYGYAYLGMCAFVTLFMIGAPLGACFSARWKYPFRKQLVACDLVWLLLAISTYMAAYVGINLRQWLLILLMEYLLIPLALFVAAMAGGCQFAAAAAISRGDDVEITGSLYLADFVGAGCGSLLIGLIILPWGGIQGVVASILVLKTFSLVVFPKT